jgi:uncharacterized protein (DUF1778 family)
MAYEPLTARVTFRLRPDERELLEAAADDDNRRLSDWIRLAAVSAAKKEQVNRWDELKPVVQVALTHLINSMASYNSPSSDAASIDALRSALTSAR